MKGKEVSKKSGGITLIALVITIIVLLILAGVTIATLTGDNGLLSKASGAKNTSIEAEIEEKLKLAYQDYYLGQHTNPGYTFQNALDKMFGEGVATVTEGNGVYTVRFSNGKTYEYNVATGKGEKAKTLTDYGVNVGDTVKYENVLALPENVVNSSKLAKLKTDLQDYSGASSSDNTDIDRDALTWKVLDVKNGKLRLINSTPTSKKIKLSGANGYNNGVKLLDETCEVLYGSNKGTAQNLKIEDLEEKLTQTAKAARESFLSSNDSIKELESEGTYIRYPNIFSDESACKTIGSNDINGNLEKSKQNQWKTDFTSTNKLKVQESYQGNYWDEENNPYIDDYFNLFFSGYDRQSGNHWLSSRAVNYESDYMGTYFIFGLYTIAGYNSNLYKSLNASYNSSYSFRPVITLNENIQLESDGTNTWKIK